MTFLPILERELRVRARARGTYWTRFAVALVGVLLCLSQPALSPGASGKNLFNGIVAAAFLLSCGACLMAADVISAERRAGTLGLLFLTKVRSWDVLIGKLSSLGISSLCALVALFPALMIPVMAGGFTGGEACRKGLALLSTLSFALTAGLFGSALHTERLKVARWALFIVVAAALVPFVPFSMTSHGLAHHLGVFSPLVSLIAAGDVAYKAAPHVYWLSLAAVQVLAGFLLIGASWHLRPLISETEEVARVCLSNTPEEAAKAVGLYRWQPMKEQTSPIEWLVYRQHGVSAGIWATGVLALAYSGWVVLAHQPIGLTGAAASWVFAWPLGIAGALAGAGMVAWVASRFFVAVRRTGELELLLTTPLGAQSLVADQWTALKRFFVWPALGLQAALLLPVLGAGTSAGSGSTFGWQLPHLISLLLGFLSTFFGVGALCWLGLWFGLKARGQTGAIIWTVSLGKGVACLVSLLGSVLWTSAVNPFSAPAIVPVILAWVPEGAVLLFYLWLIRLARQRVLCDLAGIAPMPLRLRDQLRLRPGL